MKLAISNIAWEKNDNLIIYELLKKYKIFGLEIAPTKFFQISPYSQDEEVLVKLKKEIEDQDLELVSMQSILFGRNDLKLFESENKRNELLNYLKQGIIFAKNLGIKNIVFGNPKNRISYFENDWEIAILFFRELGEFAKKNGVTIGIEANPKIYGGNFLTETLETIKFITECQSEGIGLNLDIGTMLINKEKIELLKEIPVEKISHIHISEPYLDKINEKNRDFHIEIFKYLNEKKYKKYISIEMKQQKVEEVEEIIKYVRDLFNKIMEK